MITKRADRPSLQEAYARAVVTSDLGLPHGDAAGAQGVLAAAAWTEVHLGSDLRRLRNEWESKKPNAHWLSAREQFVAGTRAARRRWLGKLLVEEAGQFLATVRQLQCWAPAHEKLTFYAAQHGMEEPDAQAYSVLRRWLLHPSRAPERAHQATLWNYLHECLQNANRALPAGMRGRTNHHPG